MNAQASEEDCAFCAIIRGDDPACAVHADSQTLAFLDRRPLFHGHVLLVPRAHIPTLAQLPADATAPLFSATQLLARAVELATEAQGTFIAINNRVSQSVPHLHIHIVPRRRGDGLRGFFWPRHAYQSQAQMAEVAARIRRQVAQLLS